MRALPASSITAGRAPDGRACVLKQLRPEHAGREDLWLRLDNERIVLTLLANVPGVIALLDVQQDPLTLMLECADGGALDQRISTATIPPDAVRRIARDLLVVVQRIHARGVIHRDIKPSNILFAGGEVRLADFGVAAHGDPPRALPEGWEEDEVGTPPWSAPELRHHAAAHVSPAADVYGAAMTIRAMGSDLRLLPALDAALHRDPARRPSVEQLLAAVAAAG